MTDRDYFAAHCPESELSEPTWGEIKEYFALPESVRIDQDKPEYALEMRCNQRYAYADMMLKVRE